MRVRTQVHPMTNIGPHAGCTETGAGRPVAVVIRSDSVRSPRPGLVLESCLVGLMANSFYKNRHSDSAQRA